MNIEMIQRILRPENIKVLSTINAHRLLRWEVQAVTKQFVESMIDARALKVYGGYQELAVLLGVSNSKKAVEQGALQKLNIFPCLSQLLASL